MGDSSSSQGTAKRVLHWGTERPGEAELSGVFGFKTHNLLKPLLSPLVFYVISLWRPELTQRLSMTFGSFSTDSHRHCKIVHTPFPQVRPRHTAACYLGQESVGGLPELLMGNPVFGKTQQTSAELTDLD